MAASAPTTPEVTSIELPFRKSSVEPAKPKSPRKNTGNVFSDTLNKQQWAFVEYYMLGMKPNAAALRAGYSESTALVAHDLLLNNPDIQAEIQKRLTKHLEQTGLKEERVIRSLIRFSESNIFDYGEIQSDGTFKIDLRNVPRELGYAIQEYTVDSQGRPRLKLVDKLSATSQLKAILGMGAEKEPPNGKNNGPLTIQALDSIVAQHVTINQQINNNVPAPQETKCLPEVVVAQ